MTLRHNHRSLSPQWITLALATAGMATVLYAQTPVSPSSPAPTSPVLPPTFIPQPGPITDQPYLPQPVAPGGIVVTLFPPGSKYLNMQRAHEAEKYAMNPDVPGRISAITNIHNPSIEVHMVDPKLNNGSIIILAAGGGHTTLPVAGDGIDTAAFLYNYGINAVILRNRLRSDGYNPKTDEVYDAQQAIRMVRAHAKEWRIDPHKIGIMGFSAGAELATAAAVGYNDWDQANNDPADPLRGISSRPDFVGVIYPGPSPFARGAKPVIPSDMPPSFITCAGTGDQDHASWANEYLVAMLAAKVPNVEMHIYATGHHPGQGSTGGVTYRADTPYGTWPVRFIDWFRDLGFLQKSGLETQAAKDVAAYAAQHPGAPSPAGAPAAAQ